MDNQRNYHRKHQRRKLKNLLPVIDNDSQQEFGLVTDINLEGMMLLTTQPCHDETQHQLTMPLPHPIDGQSELVFNINILWCEGTGDGEQYWSGCRFINIDPDTLNCMHHILDNPSY